jgi:hypothetical protein
LKSDDRYVMEARIAHARPPGVAWAFWACFLIGVLTACITFGAVARLPDRLFPVAKPLAVLMSCGAVVLAGLALGFGLLQGRLWAWFGAINAALLVGILPALLLGSWVQGGLSLGEAIAADPAAAALVALAAILLGLLWLGPTRVWFASARRLRSLPPDGLRRYLLDG